MPVKTLGLFRSGRRLRSSDSPVEVSAAHGKVTVLVGDYQLELTASQARQLAFQLYGEAGRAGQKPLLMLSNGIDAYGW